MNDVHEWVCLAEERIRPHLRDTPLEYSFPLSEQAGCNVYLKLENMQFTGSFKLRGALNKLIGLAGEEAMPDVIAASTGNHGLAVAHALRLLGKKGRIILPENASTQKVEKLRQYGIDIAFHGGDCVAAEMHARQLSRAEGLAYVSPYNDAEVIGGQGTVGVELQRHLDRVDAVYVAVGGGGLIAGIAGYLKELNPNARIIGCSPEHSPHMHASVRAGRIVAAAEKPTLSDGTAGGMEDDAITFALCRDLVDEWLLVSEQDIRDAMRWVFSQHRLVIEGSAGVAVAAFLRHIAQHTYPAGANVALVICGGNIDIEQFKAIVC